MAMLSNTSQQSGNSKQHEQHCLLTTCMCIRMSFGLLKYERAQVWIPCIGNSRIPFLRPWDSLHHQLTPFHVWIFQYHYNTANIITLQWIHTSRSSKDSTSNLNMATNTKIQAHTLRLRLPTTTLNRVKWPISNNRKRRTYPQLRRATRVVSVVVVFVANV
jgi:hypothetical protein